MTDRSRKLLIIDDDTLVRQSIATYLEDSGFEVTQVSDGNSGIRAIDESLPDLVITDLRMPDLDG
ncbi:MAG: response regulator, partial [Cellvibrio sp.]